MPFNLADCFEAVADAVPERTAVVCGDRRVTYAELEARANRCAHALGAQDIGLDAHVGCYLHNCVEYLELLLGCWKARAAPINVNDRYVASEVEFLVDDADLVGLVWSASLAPEAQAIPDLTARVRIAWEAGGPEYEAALAAASPVRDFSPRSGDDHYVLYTGGTTGRPKGVVWRQDDIFFTAMGGGNPGGPPLTDPSELVPAMLRNPNQRLTPFLPPGDPGPGELIAMSLGPLAHASGQWLALGALLGGGTVVLYDAPTMDMGHVLDLVARERVGMLTMVGDATARPLLEHLRAHPQRPDTSSIRLLGSGGSILSGEVKDALLAELPSVAVVLEAIGSSESPSQAVAVVARDAPPSASLTFAPKDVTIVVDDDLVPIPRGSDQVGRLATRGRSPIGYYKDPERSARTFVAIDGERWTLPGDMATIDADGTVHLVGRGSLCINTGGEKVYPEEVEAALKAHPAVHDAVVVGIADPTWGQRVAAVIQTDAGADAPTLEELREHCRGLVAGYKAPRALRVVDDVRRNPAGKADYPWAASLF